MSNAFFPIRGTDDIPLIGRKSVMARIWDDLTKSTPANLSVVGPKDIGKTVLLKALLERAKQSGSPYSLVVYWQLGYAPPQCDADFINQLCDHLYSAMAADTITYAEHRTELRRDRSFAALKEVMDLLQLEERSVLMIWDGFDKPLSQGRLSGQLFGNLRDLFYGKMHRVVTAARSTQSELARNKQVEDSPFWNMFDVNPIRIGIFDDSDLEEALMKAALSLDRTGKKELWNWSGGHPILLLSILNSLKASGLTELSNGQVNVAAESVATELAEFMEMLWNECSVTTKNALRSIVESDGLDHCRCGSEELRYLRARGLATLEGAKIKPACRLFTKHVRDAKPDSSTLDRMFGTWEAYRTEIRSILELRISQIRIVSNRLHRLVKRCLDDIPDFPDDCLNNLTSIEEDALDAIWKHECVAGVTIPKAVISYWTQRPRDTDNIIEAMMRDDDWRVPKDRYKQLAILQRLTGSKLGFDRQSKSVSKDTYVLLNAIHQFRNRTEHSEGQSIHIGVAVSAVLLCVELLSCLDRELAASGT